jgi:hypothetical protein
MKPKEKIIFYGAFALIGGILVVIASFVPWAPAADFEGRDFYHSRVYFMPIVGLFILLLGIACVAGKAGKVTGVLLLAFGSLMVLTDIGISSQADRAAGSPGFQVGFWLAILGSAATAFSGYLVMKALKPK